MNIIRASLITCLVIGVSVAMASEPFYLTKSDLRYLGAFKITYSSTEGGKTGYSSGRIAISPETNSFFMTGLGSSNTNMTLAEFSMPQLSLTDDYDQLPATGAPIQAYVDFYRDERLSQTTSANIRNISGLNLINGRLFVTAHDTYYTSNTEDTAFVIESPFDMANSYVTGYWGFEGGTRSSGWISPIPPNLQTELGGDYLVGMARQASVNSRWSQGPSAYSFTLSDLDTVTDGVVVDTNMLLDYPLVNRLAPDPFNYIRDSSDSFTSDFTQEQLDNCPDFVNDADLWKQECVLDNDLWTEVARAFYGFIVPGTRTYLALGRMGGIRHGMGYKITPVGARSPCSGECPHIQTDWDSYIWLYKVDDLIAHRNGEMTSYESRPYEYSAFKQPFDDADGDGRITTIGGADYDPETNRLYILNKSAGERVPVMLVYEIALNRPKPPLLLNQIVLSHSDL